MKASAQKATASSDIFLAPMTPRHIGYSTSLYPSSLSVGAVSNGAPNLVVLSARTGMISPAITYWLAAAGFEIAISTWLPRRAAILSDAEPYVMYVKESFVPSSSQSMLNTTRSSLIVPPTLIFWPFFTASMISSKLEYLPSALTKQRCLSAARITRGLKSSSVRPPF